MGNGALVPTQRDERVEGERGNPSAPGHLGLAARHMISVHQIPFSPPHPAPAQILQHVSAAVEEERQPKDDAELVLLTRLLQLAVGCRAGLRQGRVVYAGEGYVCGLGGRDGCVWRGPGPLSDADWR